MKRVRRAFGKYLKPKVYSSGWIWHAWPWFLLIPIALNFLHPIWENDFFLHVRMGQDILAHHRLTGDPSWTFGPHVPWLTTMSVSEVLMALIFKYVGLVGFAVLQLLSGLVLIPILWICIGKLAPRPISSGSIRVGSLIGTLIAFIYMTGISPRPQTISLLLFPIICLFAIRLATLGKAPKALPLALLTLIWTWFHGYALLVGPMLAIASVAYIGGAWISKGILPEGETRKAWLKIRKQWVALLLPFLVPLINPTGFNFYISSWHIKEASSRLISEWRPLSPYSSGFIFLSIILLITLWGLFAFRHFFISKNKVSLAIRLEIVREGLLLSVSYAILAQSARTAFLLAPLVGFLAIHRSMRLMRHQRTYYWEKWELTRKKKAFLGFVGSITLFVILFSFVTNPEIEQFGNNRVPLKIYKAMNAVPGQHKVLVTYNISSTVLTFVKNSSTSIDGRTDRYGSDGARAYTLMCTTGKNWKTMLALYPGATDAILLKTDRLSKILPTLGWTEKMNEYNERDSYIWLIAPKS